MLHLNQGHVVLAQRMEEESVALFQAIHDMPGYLFALGIFGDVLLYLGEYERAMATIMDCIQLSQELNNPVGLAYALLNLGEIVRYQGDPAAAENHLKQSIEIAQAVGVQRFQAMGLHYLGRVAQKQGRPKEARLNYTESLRLFHELGDIQGMAACLEELAGEAGAEGQAERAVRLFAAAAAVRGAVYIPAPLPDREAVAEAVASLRVELDSASFGRAWAEGSAMALAQAINYALEEDN
jgi:tetratricopeptide (TPR) repeat protein